MVPCLPISQTTFNSTLLTNKDIVVLYLLHFSLKATTHALAPKPKPLVVRSTDRGRDPGLLKKWHRSPIL